MAMVHNAGQEVVGVRVRWLPCLPEMGPLRGPKGDVIRVEGGTGQPRPKAVPMMSARLAVSTLAVV